MKITDVYITMFSIEIPPNAKYPGPADMVRRDPREAGLITIETDEGVEGYSFGGGADGGSPPSLRRPALAAGACGGAQFVVALRLAGERAAGALYGTDLLGSAAGAVVTAVVLVPVLGLGRAAVAVAALAAAAMTAVAAAPRRTVT